ncbi:amino acid adenylation domain-containing protein [Dactylosporangium sp. NPDC051484]|uniref:non-ribosomal peptide synthetase n=1 Tax=Dactylosporangium sp. NPDC051484 TaxID=3154942 RepID=UPI0034505FA8
MRLTDQLAALTPQELAAVGRRLPPLPAIVRRLWTASALAPEAGLYNVVEAFELTGAVDVPALRRALDTLYARHSGLRAVVVDRFDEPRMAGLPAQGGFPFEEEDLRASPDRVPDAVRACAAQPFDLANGPLVRARLIRRGPAEAVLVLALHHLVCDGESMQVLLAELSAVYAGADPATLPAPSAAVAAQRALEAAPAAQREADLAYWRARLADLPDVPVLPTDRPRDARDGFAGRRVAVPLPAQWTDKARRAAAASGASLFDLALAAFAAVLARFCAAEDIVIGTTVNMRAEARAEGTVGFLMRTVPLRMEAPPDATPAELLDAAHRTVLGALSHSGVEFDDIVAAVGRSGTGTAPVFQAALELHHGDEPFVLAGLVVRPYLVDRVDAKFDLTLHLAAAPSAPSFLEYAVELYSEQTASALAGAVGAALTALADGYAGPLRRLPLLTDEAQQSLVARLGAGSPLPERFRGTLPERVRDRAAAHPDRPAVLGSESGGAAVDYRTLVVTADALGHRLVAAGIGPGDRVAIALPRSTGQVVALFGIWAAGAVCVPLDPALPAGRRERMLRTAGVRAVVADPDTERLGWSGLPTVGIPESGADAPTGRSPRPSDAAYVIFTSGTSGDPKPVAVRHDSLTAFGAAMDELVFGSLTEGSTVAMNAPLYFDASMQAVQLLGDGHPVLVVDDKSRTDAVLFVELLAAHGVHAVDCTPTHAEALADAGLLDAGRTGLRILVLGGEAVRPELWRRLSAAAGLTAVNVYGPTEFTVNATGCRIDASRPRPTIGRPLPGCRVEILDEALRPVPPGFPGEIHLSGPQLAIGYLGQPARTADRFVPGPGGRRWYATGDVGRWNADGEIDFLGRADAQVKVRGYRIELTEIESVLRTVPGVLDAAVTVAGAESRSPRLAAFLVSAEPDVADAAARRLAAELPAHLVPSAFHRCDRLPTTANGKLDRRALARLAVAPGPAADVAPTEATGLADGTQARLASLWAELLGVAVDRPDVDFFGSGGNSLQFTALLRRIRQAFGVQLSAHVAFRARTLATMADAIDGLLRRTAPAQTDDRTLVVAVAPGSGTPLVVMHPLGGSVLSYAPLVSLLPRGVPVWGVRSPSVAGAGPEPRDVAELVQRYTDELLRTVRAPAVNLFGWSLGGLIAVAVAAEVERRGGPRVGFTELWDCGLGTADEYSDAQLRALAQDAAAGEGGGSAPDEEQVERRLRTMAAQTSLFRTWSPTPVGCTLHVVYAAESLRSGAVTQTDWGPYTRAGATHRVVPTDHHGIVRFPAVADAAAGLIERC